MLLYVIRDWDGSMDIESAISKLTKGLLGIWMSAVESTGQGAVAFSDYFRLGMITLPHKVSYTRFRRRLPRLTTIW